jgi:hypothetical protein
MRDIWFGIWKGINISAFISTMILLVIFDYILNPSDIILFISIPILYHINVHILTQEEEFKKDIKEGNDLGKWRNIFPNRVAKQDFLKWLNKQ